VSFTYATFSTALAIEMAVPNGDPANTQFAAVLPSLIDQAEQRCYRDLDLLYATSAQIMVLTAGSSKLDLSLAAPRLLIVEDVNLVIGGVLGTTGNIASGGSGVASIGDSPPSSPANGDLWFSTTDAQLYIWFFDADSSQWVPVINGIGGAGAGGASGILSSVVAWVGDSPPPTPLDGAVWLSTTDVQLYVSYNARWVIATNGSGGTGIGAVGTSDTPPISPVNGALWFSSSDGQMYCYFNDGNSSQWAAGVNAGQGTGGVTPPSSLIVTGGERLPVCPASPEWLRMCYGLSATQGPPSYYAMNDDHSILLGPFPDQPYVVEVVGKFRPTPLYTAGTTVLTQLFPDLFFAAAMIAATGYQQNFGSQADHPQSAVSWETHYNALLASALGEEGRKRLHGWMGFTTELTPMPTRPGTPGPN
jgi:hypothetical protein